MNYEEDIRIDEGALETEWLGQPSLMFKYTKNAANARRDVELAKERLDLVKAETDSDIRKNPDKYGLEKVTEGAIQNIIIGEKDFKNANKEYLDAKYEYDIAQAAVTAISHKKDALENLGRLLALNYFSGPVSPRDISKEAQKKFDQGKANRNVKSGFQRNTK